MKSLSKLITAASLAAACSAAPLAVQAAPGERSLPSRDCFQSSQWRGYSAPSDDVLLLRVRNNDVYRVEVPGGARHLRHGSAFIVSEVRGSGQICSPLDLDLKVADTTGWRSPLIARSITKLTPEEVAALPARDRP